MKLYTLGCNGWIPTVNQTCCFMIEKKGNLILLDAGTGIANLSSYKHVVENYGRISIILTHYHLDHIIGLSYLLPYIHNKEVIIYGPGKSVYPLSTEEYVKQLLQSAFFSADLNQSAKEVRYVDYNGKDFNIDTIKVDVRQQNHSAPSFRLSIDNDIIYATDTVFETSEWDNIQGHPLLLHECWTIKEEHLQHTSLEKIMQGLDKSKFREIWLVHQNPCWIEEDRRKILQILENTNVKLVSDNIVYSIVD